MYCGDNQLDLLRAVVGWGVDASSSGRLVRTAGAGVLEIAMLPISIAGWECGKVSP